MTRPGRRRRSERHCVSAQATHLGHRHPALMNTEDLCHTVTYTRNIATLCDRDLRVRVAARRLPQPAHANKIHAAINRQNSSTILFVECIRELRHEGKYCLPTTHDRVSAIAYRS